MNKAHKFIHLQGSGSWVSSSIYTKGIESHLMVPGPSFHSWAMFWVMRYVLGLPSFMVLGLMSQVSPVRWVSGLGSQVPPKVGSQVSGSIFWIWLKISMEKFNNFLYLQNFCSTKGVYIASALFWEIPKYHVLSID